MERSIADIQNHLHDNTLWNKGDKTELLLIGTPQQLKKLKSLIDKETVTTAVNALVTPHLDYGNGLATIWHKNIFIEWTSSCPKLCFTINWEA